MLRPPQLLINSESNVPKLNFSPIKITPKSQRKGPLNMHKPEGLLIPSFGSSGDTIDSMEKLEEDNIPMSFYEDPSITSKLGKPSENPLFMEPGEFEKKIRISIPKLRHELNERAFNKNYPELEETKGPSVRKLRKNPMYRDMVNRNNYLRFLHSLKGNNPLLEDKIKDIRKKTQKVDDKIDYRKRRMGKGSKKNKLRFKTIARLTKKLINLRNRARKKQKMRTMQKRKNRLARRKTLKCRLLCKRI